jgi:hypothetical protein
MATGSNDLPAAVASLGPEVDDPVGGFDDVEVCSMMTMVFPSSAGRLRSPISSSF